VIGTRRSWFLVPAAAGVIVAAALIADGGADGGGECRSLLVPAYVPPDEVLELARAVRPQLLVVNPASGPGAERQDAYRTAVRDAQRAGARVLGYVPTGYGGRDAAEVEADIDRYEDWYGTDGVFLDEASGTDEQLAHYRALAGHARAPGERLVVLNPGAIPARGYFDVADVVVTFEGSYAEYEAARASTPAWLEGLAADRVAVLVYGASREQAAAITRDAGPAGYVYATSGTLPHPWGTVPAYLADDDRPLGRCAGTSPGRMASLAPAAALRRPETRLSDQPAARTGDSFAP